VCSADLGVGSFLTRDLAMFCLLQHNDKRPRKVREQPAHGWHRCHLRFLHLAEQPATGPAPPLIVCCTTCPIALRKNEFDLQRKRQQVPWTDQTRRTIPGEPFDLGKRESEWRVPARHASSSTVPAA